MNKEAVKELLYKIADDELIIGHRNSEWTGLGPVLEEDIAFSSMAQDKIGHAQALYQILHEHFGEQDPDTIAFNREEKAFKCCHLVEFPIGEYDFSLMRHFLFDHAEMIRFEMLASTSVEPLALLAKKIKGELKYHVMHADTWIKQLGHGSEESNARMQTALNECMPLALGIFEAGPFEKELATDGVFPGEEALKEKWVSSIRTVVEKSNLTMPDLTSTEATLGGRNGYHTEHLQPLLTEMTEVFQLDPSAQW